MNKVQHRKDLTEQQLAERAMFRTGCKDMEVLKQMAKVMKRLDAVVKEEFGKAGLCGYREYENWVYEYMRTQNLVKAAEDKVNVWDGEVAEYMELLRNCIPVLLKTTVDMGESTRYLATNQILLKLWPLLLEEAEGMERKIKSTGENKESVLKQAFDEWKKDLPQYSEL